MPGLNGVSNDRSSRFHEFCSYLISDMGIPCRRHRLRMPENAADDGEGEANADAGKGMPKVVDADIVQPGLLRMARQGF